MDKEEAEDITKGKVGVSTVNMRKREQVGETKLNFDEMRGKQPSVIFRV